MKRKQLFGLSCIGTYAFSLVFDGVIRWMLDFAGIPALLYARDALPLFAIASAWVITKSQVAVPQQRLFVSVLVFLSIWLLWGILHGLDPLQSLFGAKTLLSIPTGIALWVLLQGRSSVLPIFCLIAGTLAFAGIALDYFRDLPWAGLIYEIGDLQIEGQREWRIQSLDRLAGFSRASFDAASQMAVMATLVLTSGLNRSLRWPFVALLIAGIIFTTSRTAILGMFAVLVCWSLLRRISLTTLRWAFLPTAWLPVLAVLLVLFLPGITNAVEGLDRGGTVSTRSFAMRTEGNWIDSLNMLSGAGDWLMGLGVGGVGAAQKAFDPDVYVAPDNLFIYTLVSFGIVGSLLVFAGLTCAWFTALVRPNSISYCILLILVSASGITISAVENSFLGVGLGLALAEGFAKRTAGNYAN